MSRSLLRAGTVWDCFYHLTEWVLIEKSSLHIFASSPLPHSSLFLFSPPPRSEMLMCWNQNLTRGRRDSQKFLSGAIWGRRAEEQSLKWLKGICMNNFQCGILIAMTFYFEMQIDYRIAQLLPCELLEVVCTWRALYSEQKHIICYQVGEWIMLRAF